VNNGGKLPISGTFDTRRKNLHKILLGPGVKIAQFGILVFAILLKKWGYYVYYSEKV